MSVLLTKINLFHNNYNSEQAYLFIFFCITFRNWKTGKLSKMFLYSVDNFCIHKMFLYSISKIFDLLSLCYCKKNFYPYSLVIRIRHAL